MKRTEAESVGEIIHKVFLRVGLEEDEARQRALYMWSEIVGQGVNRMTTKRYVTDAGVMHVYVQSAALKQDLQFMRSTLVSQLNAAVGSTAITELIIH